MAYYAEDAAGICYVPIGRLRVNHRKLRKLSQAKIRQYIEDYEAGDDFPPLSVLDCGEFFIVRDGRHRLQAQLACGYSTVAVLIMNSPVAAPAPDKGPVLYVLRRVFLCGLPKAV